VTVFSVEGDVVRTFATPQGANPIVLGVFEDGSLLTAPRSAFELRDDTSGIVRPPVDLQVLSPEGALVGEIGPFPGREVYFSGRGAEQATPFFARETIVGVGGNRVYTADSGTFEIEAHEASEGSLVWDVSHPFTPVAVDPANISALREMATSSYEQVDAGAQALLVHPDDIPAQTTYPVVTELVEDETGNLWVRNRLPTTMSEGQVWSIFSPEGNWVGDLEIPRNLDLLAVGDRSVLVAMRDSLGVTSVQLHRLTKP